MITTVALRSFERSINSLLQTDPANQAKLAPLAGRVISIEIQEWPKPVFLTVTAGKIGLASEHEEAADIAIKGSAWPMLQLLKGSSPADVRQSGVEIQGDLTVAQQFSNIARTLDIDWEEKLSHWVGDIAAHRIGRFVRGTSAEIKVAQEQFSQAVTEYMKYESGLFPAKEEVDDFLTEIDNVRLAMDRLEAKINQLTQRKD